MTEYPKLPPFDYDQCTKCGALFDDAHPHVDCAKRHVCGCRGDDDGTCVGCQNVRKLHAWDDEARAWAAASRKRPYIFDGVDLRAELRRFYLLPVFRGCRLKRVPPLRIRRGAQHSGVSGHAKVWSGRIVLTIGYKSELEDVLEALLHELAHVSLPNDEWHGDGFIMRLVRAAREAWGIEIASPLSVKRGENENRAYAVDHLIRAALVAKFAREPESRPPVVEPEPPVDLAARRAARREALVAKRADHAHRMLERNEAKAKRAAALVKKWRAKVRYYDRAIAAKRGGK